MYGAFIIFDANAPLVLTGGREMKFEYFVYRVMGRDDTRFYYCEEGPHNCFKTGKQNAMKFSSMKEALDIVARFGGFVGIVD
jgi:hypothetical protein